MAELLIQGINCIYRDKEFGEEVLYENLSQDEQFFQRESPPFTDEDIVAIANKEQAYSDKQLKWIAKQVKIFENGVYAYINGELKYIPGSYWDYVNNWTLENGVKPEYRESDRLYYIFCDYCEGHPDIFGVIRGKGRRQGATSMSVHRMVFNARRKEFFNCGMVSKTGEDAKTIFTKMVMFGFKALLPCFQPEFDSDDDSKTILRFVKPMDKRKKGLGAIKREGLNSYIDFKSTALNSYDMQRMSNLLIDESGKFPKDVNINDYWDKMYSTLKEGKFKRGFAYLPTTVNPLNNGGLEFKLLWEQSNQFKEDWGIHTPTKLVRYFVAAYEGYAGFVDKFGNSMVEEAKEYILAERAKKSGNSLLIHRQEYPMNEADMFAFAYGTCEFDELKIREQLDYLELNKSQFFLRQIRLKSIVNNKTGFMDDPKGCWLLYEKPEIENNISDRMGYIEGLSTARYCIGVDTFGQGFAAAGGSNGTICVFKKSYLENGQEKGLYPVAFYVGKTRLIQHFYEEVLKACVWYGCKVNYEIDRGDFYYGYFCERNAVRLLEWTPAQDPMQKNRLLKPGTESANPFQLAAQLEAAKSYVDGTDPDGYNGNVHRIPFPHLLTQLLEYNHEERTPYDSVISLMMALLVALKQTKATPVRSGGKPLLRTYKLRIPA